MWPRLAVVPLALLAIALAFVPGAAVRGTELNAPLAVPLGTAFTYQGQLKQAGAVVNGTCDIRFRLYDAATGGLQVGGDQTASGLSVSNGLFTVTLDFGAAAFTGEARWLEIAPACPAGSGFATLSPRQPLTPAPDALFARNNWSLTGNSGTTPGTSFVGTADNQALELKVNGVRALRLEPNATSPNVVGGFNGNSATGATGATIGGGGQTGSANSVSANFGTIGGGCGNSVSASLGTIGGGCGNSVSGILSTVGGGTGNTVSGARSTVGGGENNTTGPFNHATVGGGESNTARGARSTVAGGEGNLTDFAATRATIGGGQGNQALDNQATVAGGAGNTAGAARTTVGGGQGNQALGNESTVAGGASNTASGARATVGGGVANVAGPGNQATVGGGDNNAASGARATVPGGHDNVAAGDRSFAAGRRAKANHNGAFVWGDATNADITSTQNNEFTARTSGGARFFSDAAASVGVTLAPGGSGWVAASDRAAKSEFAPVDGRAVLAALAALPIETWSYRTQDPAIRHIGPMAQDFAVAFGVGDDPRGINSVDADGVALAAIQGLYQLLQDQEAALAAEQAHAATLEARLAALQAETAIREQTLESRLAALERAMAAGAVAGQ